jgi:hexosaminidase
LPAQGYVLEIEPGEIRLAFADDAGERYGLAALRQLRAAFAGALPCLRIRDWPDFAVRGYMLDVSRDRVPTRETLRRIVDLLELLRINHLQLYTEHSFAYAAHEPVWRHASPLTPDDVRWLDALCAAKGIELAANQNGFGHMERWLRVDGYRHLAEAPGGWTTSWGETWPAATLYPDDASRELVLGLYRELRACFSSRRINVNFDETFELGKGRSQARVEAEGRGRVYLDFLLPIVEELQRDGAEVLFWGDVLRHHPRLVDELPDRDLVALVWHYEAPVENPSLPAGLESILAEIGIDENVLRGFAGQVPVFARGKLPFWVCPGTSSWNSLLGRWSNARANLLDAAEVGAAHGAGGYLITDWGDNGHMQPPSVSFAPLTYGACLAWCAANNRELDVAGALDRFVWRDESGALGAAALRAAEVYSVAGTDAFNGSPLFYPLIGRDLSLGSERRPTGEDIRRVLNELDEAAAAAARARPRCADGELIVRELRQAIRLARLGARVLARNHRLAGFDASITAAEIEDARTEQRACWRARSRPGGLDDSLHKLRL